MRDKHDREDQMMGMTGKTRDKHDKENVISMAGKAHERIWMLWSCYIKEPEPTI